MPELFQIAYDCLLLKDPAVKVAAVRSMAADWQAGALTLNNNTNFPELVYPGRPEKPELLPATAMPRRRLGNPEGHAAMIHAIAHIEFNAINLACDAIFRFRDMPQQYYADWVKVTLEEAYHFSLLVERLAALGYSYGDFPGHDGLWDLARKTAHDSLQRMALIPRVMEARGLDVTPGITRRFANIGDQDTVKILDIILRDEVGHVEAGTRWFNYLCEQQGKDPETTFFEILAVYFPKGVRCPLHISARLDAGFTEQELIRLESLCNQ